VKTETEDTRPVVYGLPSDPLDPFWETHRMGGCVIPARMTWERDENGNPVLVAEFLVDPSTGQPLGDAE
jgi:hypothetical protein